MEILVSALQKVESLSTTELNEARVRFSNKSLLQAVREHCGEEVGEALLRAVLFETNFSLVRPKPNSLTEELFGELSIEIARLARTLHAAPVAFKEDGGKKTLEVGITDPDDKTSAKTYSQMFRLPAQSVLVREDELFAALEPIFSAYEAKSLYRSPRQMPGEDRDFYMYLRSFFREVLSLSPRGIEFEVARNPVSATIYQTHGGQKSVELKISPEQLVNAVLCRSEISQAQNMLFQGAFHIDLMPVRVDARIEYFEKFKRNDSNVGQRLFLSDFKVGEPDTDPFWHLVPNESVVKLRALLDEGPGLYFAAVPNPQDRLMLLAPLQQVYPDMYVVEDPRELQRDPSCLKRATFSRVLVLLPQGSVLQVCKSLQSTGAALRKIIKGIFSYRRIPRQCPFCYEDCRPSEDVLKILPETIRPNIGLLRYPRGCPVCSNQGYLGECGVLSVAPIAGSVQQLFTGEYEIPELAQVLEQDGFQSNILEALNLAISARTTVELIKAAFKGPVDLSDGLFRAKSKEVMREGVPMPGEDDPLDFSPLQKERIMKSGSGQFHSVVLDAGEDLLAAREALLAEEKSSLFGDTIGAPSSESSTPPNTAKGEGFHSVVLQLDDDLLSARDSMVGERPIESVFGETVETVSEEEDTDPFAGLQSDWDS